MEKIRPIIQEIAIEADGPNIFEAFKNDEKAIFLDSGLRHQEIGRYSFIVSEPFLVVKSKGRKIEITREQITEKIEGDPFLCLKRLFSEYQIETRADYPPFQGGAVGYFSYDLGRQLEELPDWNKDDLNVPDYYLGFYDKGVAIDRLNNRVYIFATGLPLKGRESIDKAKRDITMLRKKILKYSCTGNHPGGEISFFKGEMEKHFSKDEYCKVIQKAIDYIAAGDIFQVNISQRFSVNLETTPWNLYKKLRDINPAPFAAFLDLGELTIVSSSPERFIRISGSTIETRPIKGTRPRGRTPEEDLQLRNELINSEKDKAELVMIVDLERNDLGRICQFGTVEVEELFRLEEYATVYHLVSTIKGELRKECDVIDALKATFPGGSITGAPKIRAMEIIEELEPVKRGVYTGSIGYLGFNGESDLNIVIRTFVIKNGKAYFQTGGGIVADSDPVKEYEETLHKAKALKKSLGL
ncbi:MAG: para-aminobenzoate synthetase component [Clostridia bacterium]|jgi:para-aminobenzoate synthetase component 1|nr:para-aminobenzoate synthetase component [Clostridia bacterium]